MPWKRRIGSAAGRFDPGGKEVDVFDHGGVGGAGFDLARPAGDEAGLEAAVVTGPLSEGHGAALFAGDDEERVVGEFVFFEKLHRLANLTVVVGDLGKVAGHGVADGGGVDEVGRELNVGWRVAGGVAFVPG